jgi:uncharacterized protein YbjT (DUF2867 family)
MGRDNVRVLVLGASGYIGSHLVPRLLAAGYRVRAGARSLDVLEARGWPGTELVQADVFDTASLERALEGCNVAYYLVHSMAAGPDFARRDREAADAFAAAAARAGVGRIVYLGGLQPNDSASEHLASRRETAERLRAGPVPVTEIRAGVIVGAGSAAFEVIRDLVYHLPFMVTPRWVQSRTQPIALSDLLSYLVALPALPETAGRTFDVGGPEVLRYEDLLRQFAEVVGRRFVNLRVPVLTPRLSSYWLDLVTAVPANVARPLVEGLKHDLLADDAEIRALVPRRLRTYREAVREALDAERAEQVPARWVEGALAFRGRRADVSFYSRAMSAEQTADASAGDLWDVVSRLGGQSGWLYMNWLWRLRGAVDRAIGGVGMRRGRRHSSELRVGDAVDFWRVAAIEPGHRLTLVAEMKLPGSAVLEFAVKPHSPVRSTLTTSARFHPAGVFGLLYWYGLAPVHARIFRGLTQAIVGRAERRTARSSQPPPR